VEEKLLTSLFETRDSFSIDVYLKHDGYKAVEKAFQEMTPESILTEVKNANLRGRGGAGFPAGVKWSFVPKEGDKPKYLCVNADEGEPGTIKDRYIMSLNPHLLLEGIIIASFCVGINTAYIYIRGEYENVALRLEEAIAEAHTKGYLGNNILNSGFNCQIYVHRGAGAYICGEETALLESLEGKRGNPRLKPPFPALVGLFQSPTVINNIETLSNVPGIILNGADAFVQKGLPKDGGTRIFGVSGMVQKPGIYEMPVGTSLKEIIFDLAGGMKDGKKLKGVIPGGMSAPILTADEIDIKMDVDSLAAAKSMLGSAAIIVIDEETSILDVLKIVTKFYSHESCGQCTPCRIGTKWINKIVNRIADGQGKIEDIDNIKRLAKNIMGKTLCPLGEAAAMPILAIVDKFRTEIESYIGN